LQIIHYIYKFVKYTQIVLLIFIKIFFNGKPKNLSIPKKNFFKKYKGLSHGLKKCANFR